MKLQNSFQRLQPTQSESPCRQVQPSRHNPRATDEGEKIRTRRIRSYDRVVSSQLDGHGPVYLMPLCKVIRPNWFCQNSASGHSRVSAYEKKESYTRSLQAPPNSIPTGIGLRITGCEVGRKIEGSSNNVYRCCAVRRTRVTRVVKVDFEC